MSLPANAETYLSGGSCGFLVPVLAKIISCCSGRSLSDQKSQFSRQICLAFTMPTRPWAASEREGTCFSV
jgi:hypothetical protein